MYTCGINAGKLVTAPLGPEHLLPKVGTSIFPHSLKYVSEHLLGAKNCLWHCRPAGNKTGVVGEAASKAAEATVGARARALAPES